MSECPVCYNNIGKQEDGLFICEDGKGNSDMAEKCNHRICSRCCQTIYNNLRQAWKDRHITGIYPEATCPLCRENWTMWLLNYYSDEENESEEEDESAAEK